MDHVKHASVFSADHKTHADFTTELDDFITAG